MTDKSKTLSIKTPATLTDVVAIIAPVGVAVAQFMQSQQKSYEVIFLSAFCVVLYFYVRNLREQVNEQKLDNDTCEKKVESIQREFADKLRGQQNDFEQRIRTMHVEHEMHVRNETTQFAAKIMILNRTVMTIYNDLVFFADKRKIGIISADEATGMPVYSAVDRHYPIEKENRARNRKTPRSAK